RFIAVVAAEPSIALDRLAADGVMAFDRFRRPLTSHEREQRLGAGLSERQIENLDRWGYPYVFEDFRFHLTLTGPIDAERRGSILALLQARFQQGRAFAADYATFTGAPGRLVDAVPGRRPSRPNRGAFGSVEAYLIGEPSSPGAKPAITSLFPLSFHPAVTCGW